MAFKTKSQQTEFTPVIGPALGVEDGENIDEIEGKLIGIFDVRQAGKSTVQNAELDTQFGKVKVAFWGTEIPKTLKGKRVKILATNKKFGEITYKINEYDGKNGHVTEETLSVGNNADVEEVTGASAPQQSAPAAPAQRTHVEKTSGFSLMEAAESLATQHLLVNDVVRAAYAKKNYDEETLRSYVSTVWIGLDRAAMVIIGQSVDGSPLRQDARGSVEAPKEAHAPTQASDTTCNPQNWAEAIIPAGPLKGKTLGEVGKANLTQLETLRADAEMEGKQPKFPAFAECVKQAAIDLELGGDLPF